jgi:hypothetical protein
METASNMETAKNVEMASNMETTGDIDTTGNIDTTNNIETTSTTQTTSSSETTSDDKCGVCGKDCDGVACELYEATPYCGDVCEEADLYVRTCLTIETGKTD